MPPRRPPPPTPKARARSRSVRVAALPIAETGALWAAIDEGIFEDHGIEVEVVPAQGGAQAIPALLSGDIQFAIGQPFGPSVPTAGPRRRHHRQLRRQPRRRPRTSTPSCRWPTSGITGPADLAGKRVSVNSLGAAGDVTIMKAVEDAGGDPSTIEFVEVAFPDAQAQLEAGNIDAAWVSRPVHVEDRGRRRQPRRAPVPGHDPRADRAHHITTQELIDSDPELVSDFAAAMTEALDWATANEDAVVRRSRPTWKTRRRPRRHHPADLHLEITVSDLEELAALAVEFGVLDAEPDFDRLVQQQ